MSAPMAIGDQASYVFMSPELEESVSFEDVAPVIRQESIMAVTIQEMGLRFKIVSVESDRQGLWLDVCVDPGEHYNRFLLALLEDAECHVEILGKTFISKIFKLELGRAYLGLTR